MRIRGNNVKKLISVCVAMVVVLTGCATNSVNTLYSNEKKISSEDNSYNLNSEEQNIGNQKFTGKLEFEGMDTIWVYEAEDDCQIAISYLLSVTSGKAKLVLIAPDGGITTIVENEDKGINEDITITNISLYMGENRIKLVAANKAKLNLEIQSEVGVFSEVGMK